MSIFEGVQSISVPKAASPKNKQQKLKSFLEKYMNSVNTVNDTADLFFQYSRRDLILLNMSARLHNFHDVPFSLTTFYFHD